jgi:hypothetical protein
MSLADFADIATLVNERRYGYYPCSSIIFTTGVRSLEEISPNFNANLIEMVAV